MADGTNNSDGFKDGSNTGNDYTYDTMGNLKTDQNKKITNVKYNHLNLPTEVVFNTGKIGYTYDAVGTRIAKKVEATGGTSVVTDYLDGFQYKDNVLKFFHQPEGFVEYKNNQYIYHYIYKDHLGNNRLTYADLDGDGEVSPGEIIEENNYYPFGLRHKGYNELATENPSGFKYKFGGKELNDELGFEVYDFGARNYDPALGRWMNIDPLAEKFYSLTGYNYAVNNPIFFIDPDGMESFGFATSYGVIDLEKFGGKVMFLKTGLSEFERDKGDDVIIKGNMTQEAFEQLNKSTSLKLKMDKNGKLSASGSAVTDSDKLLLEAINDENITVKINATDKNKEDGEYIFGDAFNGSSVKKDGKVVAKQTLNPNQTEIIEKFSEMPYGSISKHATLEAYIGAKNDPGAGPQQFNAYLKAHNETNKIYPDGDFAPKVQQLEIKVRYIKMKFGRTEARMYKKGAETVLFD